MNIVKIIDTTDVYSSKKIQSLCHRKYRGHNRGCPNWNKDGHPPNFPILSEVAQPGTERLIGIKFDISDHFDNMRKKHPEWSEYQVKNCLYFQGRTKKMLKEYIKTMNIPSEYTIDLNVSRYGINVNRSLRKFNERIKFPIEKFTWEFCVIYKKRW